MFQKVSRSPIMLGLSAAAVVTLAVLAACGQAAIDPSLSVDSADKGRLSASKPNQGNKRSALIQPTNKAFSGRAEAVLGTKRYKGKVQEMQDSELATKVSNYNFEVGTDTDGDGAANEKAEGQLDITGLGSNKIVLEQENYPVMSNQEDTLTVKNETTGNVRTYKADQDLFNYTVIDGANELSIKALPDGTWTVNGAAAATPAAAAELAMQSPIIADASVHGLMLIYQTFNQVNKVPVEVEETLSPAPANPAAANYVAATFGDPKPLLKEVIKLKLKLKKPGK